MKLTGSINCKKCNKTLEWEYIVPQNIYSPKLSVEIINTKIYHPNRLVDSENKYLFEIQCKNCDFVNRFEVDK